MLFRSDVGFCEGAGSYCIELSALSWDLGFCYVHIPRDAKSRRGVLLLIELFLLQCLNIEVPADVCLDLRSADLTPQDIRILAGDDDCEIPLGRNH